MRRAYRRGIASGLAAAAVLAAPAVAGAKPLEHEHFHDEVHETIVDCGLTLQHDGVFDGHFLLVPHGPDGLAYGGNRSGAPRRSPTWPTATPSSSRSRQPPRTCG